MDVGTVRGPEVVTCKGHAVRQVVSGHRGRHVRHRGRGLGISGSTGSRGASLMAVQSLRDGVCKS